MPRQIAKVGDVFWVPIDDGSFVLGQIVEIQKEALNSITCAFFKVRSDVPREINCIPKAPLSVQFVTKDLFNNGNWQRVGNQGVMINRELLPYRETEKSGWIGAKIIGSGIIRSFLSAYYGLRDWHEMHETDYYQSLLIPES